MKKKNHNTHKNKPAQTLNVPVIGFSVISENFPKVFITILLLSQAV